VRDLGGVGDAAMRVLGHGAGHRDRALDERGECLGRTVGRRRDGLLPADEHPEAEIVALRTFELLGLAQTLRVGQRDAFEQHGVGGISAGAARPPDQILQEVERDPRFLAWFRHRFSAHFQMGLPVPGRP